MLLGMMGACSGGCILALPAVIAIASQEDLDTVYRASERGAWYNKAKTCDEAIADANECWAKAKEKVKGWGPGDRQDMEEVKAFNSLMRKNGYKKLEQDKIPAGMKVEKVGHAKVAGK